MDVLTQIFHGSWLIQADYARAAYPLISQLIDGKEVKWENIPNSSYKVIGQSGGMQEYSRIDEEVPEGSIVVMQLHGPMMKQDQLCGPRGTAWLAQQIEKAGENPNVEAIILDIDSPGGQVNGTEQLSLAISNSSKPVYGFGHFVASAAYWAGSHTKELWLSGETAMAGSIGVVCTVADVREAWEQRGIKLTDVYSKTSPNKNGSYREAMEGKFDRLAQELTDLDSIFMDSVRSQRPNISEKALTGEMYLAKQAIELGLADQIGSLSELVAHIRSTHQNSFTNPSIMAEEKQEGGVLASFKSLFKKEDDVIQLKEQIDAKERSLADSRQELTNAQERIQALEASKQQLSSKLEQAQKEAQEWKQKAEAYGAQPGEMPTDPQSPKPDGEAELPAWYDPEAEHNKTARSVL